MFLIMATKKVQMTDVNNQDVLHPETETDMVRVSGNGGGGNFLCVKEINGFPSVGASDVSEEDFANKADKVENATQGNFASLDENGNITDSGNNPSDFQATLVSGTNIKTINGETVLGSGNVQVNTPFKGWFDSSSALETAYPTPSVGDYAYVHDISPATTTSIYKCDTAGTWADSGTDADTSNVQTFASGEEVNETYIDDTHLVNPKDGALPTAADVMQLKAKLEGVTAQETKASFTIIDGYYINYDGSLRASSDLGHYTVIQLNGAKRVRFLGYTLGSQSGNNYSYAFWNNPTYIDSSTVVFSSYYDLRSGDVSQPKEYIADVPDGATYIAISVVPVNLQTFYCYLQSGKSVGDMTNAIVDSVEGKFGYVDMTVTLKEGKCYNPTTSNNFVTITRSDTKCLILGNLAGRKFKVFGNGTSSIPLIFFRNSNGAYIDNSKIYGDYRGAGYEVTPPSNAAWMYVNFYGYAAATDKIQEWVKTADGLRQEIDIEINGTQQWQEITPILYDGYYNANNNGIVIATLSGTKCFRINGVKPGDKYRVFGANATAVRLVMFKNQYGENLTAGRTPGTSNVSYRDTGFIATVPSNAYYMCVDYYNYNSDTDKIEKLVDATMGVADIADKAEEQSALGLPLLGKKIVFFGDSITEFTQRGRNIPAWFGEYSGAQVTSGAIGGTRLVPRTIADPDNITSLEWYHYLDITSMIEAWIAGDFTDQLEAATHTNKAQTYTEIINNLSQVSVADTDIVCIGGGTNDMTANSPIGTASDTTSATLLGAITNIITKLLTAKPLLKIYFYSPVVGYHDNEWDDVYVFNSGKTKPEYIEMLAAQTKQFHVPYIDLYWSMGWNEINFSTYFTQSGDYSHPYGGFNALARRLVGQVCALME